MDKSTIIITYGNDPKKTSFDLMKRMRIDKEIPIDARICIKPNLVFAKKASTGTTTHPEIVEGLIEFLISRNFRNIAIIESSSILENTQKAFRVCGYDELSQKYNIPLLDLKSDVRKKAVINGYTMDIAKTALECDYLINVPVLKGHSMTRYTGALKNIKGCIPDHEKRRFHRDGLHRPIALLNKAIRSHLIIMDALNGDVSSEFGGNPSRMNMIMAGKDPVLLDAYALFLLGIPVADVPYITMAEKLGLGCANLDIATIIETNPQEKPFHIPPAYKSRRSSYTNIIEDKACSACYGVLIQALEQMSKQGDKVDFPVYIGQGFKGITKQGVGIGSCTALFTRSLKGCPPDALSVRKFLERILLSAS